MGPRQASAGPGNRLHQQRTLGKKHRPISLGRELLEGVVAKRRNSAYEPGKRSGAWVKVRVNRRQDFIVGGYVPRGQNFDLILVGYYGGHDLKYAAGIHAGFTAASSAVSSFAGEQFASDCVINQ